MHCRVGALRQTSSDGARVLAEIKEEWNDLSNKITTIQAALSG